jgi:hypothetical protein
MNTAARILTLIAIFNIAAYGQGALTPPGAPAPTMKTLAEVFNEIVANGLQALGIQTDVTNIKADTAATKLAVLAIKGDSRIPISSIPFVIGTSGSYYLTKNLSTTTGDAIVIVANEVTVDLNGFTLSSTHPTGSGSAININGTRKNIRIRNGIIKGTTTLAGSVYTPGGFDEGILSTSPDCRNITILDISVLGTAASGIDFGTEDEMSLIVKDCTVSTCAATGIHAGTIRGCCVAECGGIGIRAKGVFESSATSTGAIIGSHAIIADDITNSRGVAVSGAGIFALNVGGSKGYSSSGIGISAYNVSNSTGSSSSGTGIDARMNVTNCVGSSILGPYGITTTGAASYCRGRSDSGVAIQAAIAVACTVEGTGTISSPQKHLGTP